MKQEFYRQYIKPFVTNEELDEAFVLKDTFIPENLYRYRRSTQRTLDEIQNSQICLIPASNQNDSSDTTLKVDLRKISMSVGNQGKDKYLKILNPPASEEELRIINSASDLLEGFSTVLGIRGSRIANDPRSKEFIAKFYSEFENFYSQSTQVGTLISSFSESFSISNMWKKYGDENRGICISYPIGNLQKSDYRRKYLFPVVYSDDSFDATDDFLAKIKEPDRKNRIAIGASMTKTTEWEKEKEWRLISFDGKVISNKLIDMPVPACIYLGKNIEPEFEKKVRDIAREKAINVVQMD